MRTKATGASHLAKPCFSRRQNAMRSLALTVLISALATAPAAAQCEPVANRRPVQTLAEEPVSRPPDRITLTWLTWGQVREVWVISEGGQARWSEGGHPEQTFTVTSADFSRIREALRPYEGKEFSCERIVPDMPYGHIVWSRRGGGHHRVGFDMGCTGADADDLLRRLDDVRSTLETLRDPT